MGRLGLGVAIGQNAAYANYPTPDQFLGASLLGYWDAERADTLSLTGSQVNSWTDIKNGYVASQSVGGSKPIYSPTSFNGRPGLTFDAVDDYLEMLSVPFPVGVDASELWAIVDQPALVADTAVRVLFSYGGGASTTRRGIQRIVSTTNRVSLVVGDGVASGGAISSADFSGRHVVRGEVGSANSTVSLDGAGAVSSAVVPATGTSRTRIGAISNPTPGNYWLGVISAVAVTTPLNADQAAQFLAYLSRRLT